VKAEESSGLLTDGTFNTAMTPIADANALSTGVWTSMSMAFSAQELANARSGMGLANLIYAADGLPGGEFPTIYQDVAVEQNSVYRLTFYAKHWNFGAEAQPLYFGYRNALQDVWTPVEQVTVTDLGGEYTQLTLEFNTKELTNIRIFAFTTSVLGGIGGYHLDDFKLEYVKEAEVIAQIGTQMYTSVQAALAAAGTDAVTVQLVADSSESDLSVGAGVTLDLNGHRTHILWSPLGWLLLIRCACYR